MIAIRKLLSTVSAVKVTGAAVLAALLAGCTGGSTAKRADIFAGIGAEETVFAAGNEPFWNAEVKGHALTYKTPEKLDGVSIETERFAGNSGLSYSGTMDGEPFDLIVTAGACDDTMADRSYPFTATLKLGEAILTGCAWSDDNPYTEEGAEEGPQ